MENSHENIYSICTKLLAGCIPSTNDKQEHKDCLDNYAIIMNLLNEEYFVKEDFIIVKLIGLCAFNEDVVTDDILNIVMRNNVKSFIRDKRTQVSDLMGKEIRLADLEDMSLESECIETVMQRVKARFQVLKDMTISKDRVKNLYKQVMVSIAEEQLKDILMTGAKILLEGKTINNNYMHGIDSIKYLQENLAVIQGKLEEKNEDIIDIMTLKSMEDDERIERYNNQSYTPVTDFGIPSIDNTYHALYTSEILGIMGITGTGKTRLASQLAYRAITIFKQHVWFKSGEQGCKELKSLLYSAHCWYKFKRYIPDSRVKMNELTPEEMEIYQSAKIDFLESGDYGLLTVDSQPMYVESMIPTLDKLNRDNPSRPVKLCIVDYLGLLRSNGNNAYGRVLTLQESANLLLALAKSSALSKNMAWCVLNQLTREETERLLDGKNARVTGGRVSGAFEHYCDKIVVLSETDKQKEQKKMIMTCAKSRNSDSFGQVPVRVNKGVSYFKEIEEEDIEL